MENTKYLYGAAVQGIQSFIFQTNELKDIVGASELVSNICTGFFAALLYQDKPHNSTDYLNKDPNSILSAAGNIKYIFESREECARIVKEFPKLIIEKVPGVTISQAVVQLDSEPDFPTAVNRLEERLRAQRNKPTRSIPLGAIGIKRSRSTGLPAVFANDKNLFLDKGSLKKKEADKNAKNDKNNRLCQDAFGEYASEYQYPYNLCNLTDTNKWMAVIHADGNGLGQVVQKIGSDRTLFREFSRKLDKVTKKAAQYSFNDLNKDEHWKPGDIIPIRPVVLGGDDLTVICRGNLAIKYVRNFIRYFEQFSKEELGGIISDYNKEHKGKEIFGTGETHLTACAGIAYIKQNYPFYYGYELAESLCSHAKKTAKNTDKVLKKNGLPPSCIMFHKVHDSFYEDYQDIKRRELLPCPGKSLQFGPYFLNEPAIDGHWSIDLLLKHADYLEANDREKNFIKSALRNWLANMHDSYEMANQIINNTKQSVYDNQECEYIDQIITPVRRGDGLDYFPAFDILTLLSVSQKIKLKK